MLLDQQNKSLCRSGDEGSVTVKPNKRQVCQTNKVVGSGGIPSGQGDITQLSTKRPVWQALAGSSVGWSTFLIPQGCMFDSPLWHIQESTIECMNGWNNRSMFLSFSPCLSQISKKNLKYIKNSGVRPSVPWMLGEKLVKLGNTDVVAKQMVDLHTSLCFVNENFLEY